MEIDSYSPYNARIKIPTVVCQPLTEVRPPVRGGEIQANLRAGEAGTESEYALR